MANAVKKSLARRILRWFLITLSSLIVLLLIGVGIVINFVFTSSKLTPMVEESAREFLNAEVKFSGIELTFFSTFPNFGLKITDGTIVSGVFRDSTTQAVDRDSLMQMKSCLVTINPMAYLLKNRIEVKDFVIEQPCIYAYMDTTGMPNWDIVRKDSMPLDTIVTDTVTTEFNSRISIKNVQIKDGVLVFDDRNTRLYTKVTGLDFKLDGFLGARRAKVKLSLSTKNILFWQQGALLVNHLALGLETEMKVNRDSLLYTLNKAVFDVNGLKFGAGGTLQADTTAHTLLVNLKYGVHIPSLKTLLDLVPDTILRKVENVDVRGEVLCSGEVKGIYGKQNIPLITADFKIIDGYIAYGGMPSRIDTLNVDCNAFIDLQKEQPSSLKLNNFCMKGGNTDVDMTGTVENLLIAPVVKSNIEAVVDFTDLTKIFPLADGITCRGKMDVKLKTDILVEDVVKANYGKLKVGGRCRINDVEIFIPKDSIVLNVKSAGIGFATNRKNENTLQGVDALNGVVGYSGLDVNIKNKLKLFMDTTYLVVKTSPLKDTTAIASVSSHLRLGRMVFIVRDTLLVGLKSADVRAELMPMKQNKKVPKIKAEFEIDSLRLRMLGNRLGMAHCDVQLTAVRHKTHTKFWRPSGYIDLAGVRAYTPMFPLRMRMPGTRIHFKRNEIKLDSARMTVGRSDVLLTGSIHNLSRSMMNPEEELSAELFVKSKCIDCNQIMKALDDGTAYLAGVKSGKVDDRISTESDDIDQVRVVNDSVLYEGNNKLFVVPPGISFRFETDIDEVLFGKAVLDSIHGEIVMKNQCIELSDLKMRSSAANMDASMIYKAKDTIRAYAGFAVKMHDIRIDSLVRLIPSLDTLFPMLRAFEGEVDFHLAAESWLDSTMSIELPTLRAAAYLDGHDLVLMDGETFAEISKMLMFKNKKRNLIDSVSVDLVVRNGAVEIFPFMVEIDRYKAAVGGKHNIDMTFNYHVSLLKSPLPFRAGVDIYGSLDKMKFKITKAKYKDMFIPSRRTLVDSTQLNLKKQVRELLRGGD